MAMTIGQFGDFIAPGFRQMYYDSMKRRPERVWQKIFNIKTSQRNYEKTSAMSGLGLASRVYEGQNIPTDSALQLYDQTLTMIKYGTGVEITEETYSDELYNSWQKLPGMMSKSMEDALDVLAAIIFNSGTGTTYYSDPLSEALFHDTHTMALGGTVDNEHTAAALSSTALGTAIADWAAWTDHRGILVSPRPAYLLVPPELEVTARKVLDSTHEPETANNAINPLKARVKLLVWPQLTGATRWFLLAEKGDTDPDGHKLLFYWRNRPDLDKDYSHRNRNLMWNTRMRFVFGFPDWWGTSTNAGA